MPSPATTTTCRRLAASSTSKRRRSACRGSTPPRAVAAGWRCWPPAIAAAPRRARRRRRTPFDALGYRLDAARTQVLVGRALRRAGQRSAPRPTLLTTPMPGCGDARRAVGGAGGRRARAGRARPGGATLTPTESRIADLVAHGRRNREIAGELLVSAATVEAHLTRIYRKLGVRSRTELVQVWVEQPEPRGWANPDENVGEPRYRRGRLWDSYGRRMWCAALMFVGVDEPVPLLDGRTVPYVNLDNAASTPPFVAVLETIERFLPYYSGVHRGTGYKSRVSTAALRVGAGCRRRVRRRRSATATSWCSPRTPPRRSTSSPDRCPSATATSC